MQTSTATEDVVTHRYRKAIVLWDIEHCTISKTFPIVTLFQNINEVLAHAIGYGWKPIDVERRVYLNYKSKNTHHPPPSLFNSQVHTTQKRLCLQFVFFTLHLDRKK
jgi:hypothetical protein